MLSILYQDEWFVAVDKPAGQLVHPADEPQEGDLVTMKILRDQIGQEIHVIHRLDRPTCGILLFAIDGKAAKLVRRQFEKRTVTKIYHALVVGQPAHRGWTSREALRKEENAPFKQSETEFHVLKKTRENTSLVEARPKTGRYHQIRRHLLQAGHPIVGDYRYLGIERCEQLGKKLGIGTRMMLQAHSLTFTHPFKKEALTIISPPDPLFLKTS